MDGCHVDDIVGITNGKVVGGGVGVEGGLLVGVEVIGNANGDGVGKIDASWLGSFVVVGKYLLEGVDNTEGI